MLVTALATPFKEGKIDALSYERLIARQVGVADALLCCGTTAEAMLLDRCEKKLLMSLAKGAAPDMPLWMGVEDADTREAAANAERAREMGACGVLVAPPAFVKCTSRGYAAHVRAIAKACELPIMLYNVPSRCGYVLDEGAVDELAGVARFFKDAGSDLGYTRRRAERFEVLCGNDGLLCDMLEAGARGVVSVVSNVAPRLTKAMLAEPLEEQKELFFALARLSMAEVSPIAVKYMLTRAGVFDSCDVRLPLTAASSETRAKIDALNWEAIA